MSNDFYNHGSFPTTGSAATSASMRAELDSIAAGFDKMPTLTGNANEIVVVNSSATGLTAIPSLPATAGGTGQTSYAVGDLLYASTTTALSKLADVATGNALISGGVGVAPSWGKIGLTTHVTGTLPVANGGTGLTAGTSGGVLYYSATGTLASSAALAASALVVGGGAGVAPSTITTGTGVVTALGVAVGSAGAFVVNGGALGTPSSGTVTNLTGTASININGTVGATTPSTGAFTTLTTSGLATLTGGSAFSGTASPASGASVEITYGAVASTGRVMSYDRTGAAESTLQFRGTPITFLTAATERMRLDSSGNLLMGTTASAAYGPWSAGLIQAAGTSEATSVTSLSRFAANSGSPILLFNKSRGATIGTNTVVASGDNLGLLDFLGADGTSFVPAARITAQVDGTPGTNDMPGRLVFSTTADGASSPTEAMRIASSGNVGIGNTSIANTKLRLGGNITGATTAYGAYTSLEVQPDVTTRAVTYASAPTTAVGATPNVFSHFYATQSTFSGTPTSQYGFEATSGLTGATNNYGFYSNIASGTGRWNFYAAGTAENYFGGNTVISVTDNTNAALRITQLGTGNALLVEDSANPDSTPFAVDASGNVIVGSTTAANTTVSGTPNFSQAGVTATSTRNAFSRWDASASGFVMQFGKSRGGAVGTPGIVSSGDSAGQLQFYGDDGTSFVQLATISANVDGTPGTNDMPGRLVFSTTADGASSPTEAIRIDNAQRLIVQKSSNGALTSLTSSAASIAVNLNLANNFTHTTTENTTLANPTNMTAGQYGVIVITQGATPRTMAFGSYWKFAAGTVPSLTATASAVDVLAYYVESATRITARLIADVK